MIFNDNFSRRIMAPPSELPETAAELSGMLIFAESNACRFLVKPPDHSEMGVEMLPIRRRDADLHLA